MKSISSLVIVVFCFFACQQDPVKKPLPELEWPPKVKLPKEDTGAFRNAIIGASDFVNIAILLPEIIQEIRYADTNNFTHTKIYDCPACFLQKETALALDLASQLAALEGYRLKVFDCYRAYDYQVKLYEAFPDFNYVAKPAQGSMHSYGCAVDLTLTDEEGNELDMGTAFDSFDKKSYSFSTEIDSTASWNRATLRTIMNQAGFNEIKTEWWHFSFAVCDKKVNTNLKWTCP